MAKPTERFSHCWMRYDAERFTKGQRRDSGLFWSDCQMGRGRKSSKAQPRGNGCQHAVSADGR